MKKGIIVLLITVLVSGIAFAGLTGSAEVKGNLDLNALKAKEAALVIANDSEIAVDLGIADLAVAPAALEEGAEAPAVSVDFAASFKFKVNEDGETKATAKISKASIKGANWEVSILGSADAFNYASMYGFSAKGNYAKNPGVTVTYDGFKLGLGYTTKGTWNASLETKSFEVIEGLTIKGGVSYSATAAAPEYGYYFTDGGYSYYYEVFATNADGTYSTDRTVTTGSVEITDNNKGVTGKFKDNGTYYLADYQKKVNDAQDAYDAAKKAFDADPSEGNYEDLASKTSALSTAKSNLSNLEIEVKAKYQSTSTYSYVNDEGKVKTKRTWGGLKASDLTTYGNIGDDAISELGASLSVGYASDMLNGSVAADLIFDTIAKKAIYDVKASASFMGAGLDVYYSNLAKVKSIYTGKDVKVEKALNAQLNFDLNQFVELPVTVSGSVGMENILGKSAGNGKKVLKTSLSVGYEAISLSASFNYGLVDKNVELAGELSYEHEIVTATVGASYATVEVVTGERDDSDYAVVKQLGMYVSAENTTLIPGATLGLSWAADDLTKVNPDVDNKLGVVTASCSIAF